MSDAHQATAFDRSRERLRGDCGLTLIELLMAVLILGVLLSSLAAVLITSVRAAAASEQRVLATAAQSQVQEGFQSVPWELTGIYQDELDTFEDRIDAGELHGGLAAIADRFDFTMTPPEFDERPIVVLVGPDCPGPPDANGRETCADREARAPAPWSTPNIGSEDYDLFQMVTWVDRSGNGVEDVKRLTSVARWTSSGREYFDSFESERAPTSIEAGDPSGVRVWFDLSPRTIPLGEDTGLSTRDIQAYVRFTEPVTSAVLQFYRAEPGATAGDPTQLELVTIPMTTGTAAPVGLTGFVDFSAVLPAASSTYAYPNGGRTFRVVGTRGAESFSSSRVITFTDGPFPDDLEDPLADEAPGTTTEGDDDSDNSETVVPPSVDVALRDLVVTPGTVTRKSNNKQFRCDLVISVRVDGMTLEDQIVTATAQTATGPQVFTLQPNPGPAISLTNQLYSLTLGRNKAHGFQDVSSVRFVAKATRSSDGQEATLNGNEIALIQSNSSC